MVYPVFLLVVGLLVVTAMMMWVVPNFAPMFEKMERDGTAALGHNNVVQHQ